LPTLHILAGNRAIPATLRLTSESNDSRTCRGGGSESLYDQLAQRARYDDQARRSLAGIRDAQTSLSANDRAIAAIILRDPFRGRLSTAEQVAAAAGVSKAAVARFGMRLGYAGYAELRQDLRNRWQERSEATQRSMDQDVEGRQLDGAGIVQSLLTSRLAQDV